MFYDQDEFEGLFSSFSRLHFHKKLGAFYLERNNKTLLLDSEKVDLIREFELELVHLP